MKAKNIKTIACLIGTTMLLTTQPKVFAESEESQNKINNSVILYVGESKAIVNNKEKQIDVSNSKICPVIISDKTLVPVRFISENFGATVSLEGNTINISSGDQKVILEIGSNKIVVNGIESMMPVESQVINDRTFIPLRSMAEALGKKVFWDNRGLIIISNTELELNTKEDKDKIESIISRFVHKSDLNTNEIADPNEVGNSSGNLANFGYVAQKGEWIYYRNSSDDDKLYKIKIDGTNKSKISDDKPSFINVVSGWIYYANESDDDKPYKISVNGGQSTKLDDNGCGNIFVVGENIYFSRTIGLKVYADIYRIKNDGTSKEKITKGSRVIQYINVIDDWIYFSDFVGGRILKMKLDGTKETELNNFRIGKYVILDNTIYFSNVYEKGTMYKMNMKGMETEKIDIPDNVNDFNIIDGWIYYSNKSDGDKLYKMKLDRTSKVKLSDIQAASINIIGDWIYFRDKSDKVFNYYRIKKDGTGQEIVN